VKYAWLAIAIFAARFLATAIAFPQLDGDLAWQRWLGAQILQHHAIPGTLGIETFTAPGAPWIAQEWAFSLAAAAAGGGLGWTVFAGGTALLATAALALAAMFAERRGASPRANALCTLLAGVALFASFGVRAQVVAWPLLALFLLLLDCDSPVAYAAIGVAALWSNVHASALLAPLLALAATAGTILDEGFAAVAVRRRALIAAGSAIAVCCNPFGWGLPLYALRLFASPFKSAISEWRPPSLDDSSFVFGALPLLALAIVFLAGPGPRRARDAIVLGVFGYLVLSATRNVALFGLVALPLVASALTRHVAFLSLPRAAAANGRAARYALPAFAGLLAILVAFVLLHGAERRGDYVAKAAMADIAGLPGPHRILCADFAWCSLALGHPGLRVFLDGRADPYPAAVWSDYIDVVALRSDWLRVLMRREVDTIVVARGAPLDQALARTAGWRRGYADARYRVWLRLPDLGQARSRPPRLQRPPAHVSGRREPDLAANDVDRPGQFARGRAAAAEVRGYLAAVRDRGRAPEGSTAHAAAANVPERRVGAQAGEEPRRLSVPDRLAFDGAVDHGINRCIGMNDEDVPGGIRGTGIPHERIARRSGGKGRACPLG
jgi:hypothetical protein